MLDKILLGVSTAILAGKIQRLANDEASILARAAASQHGEPRLAIGNAASLLGVRHVFETWYFYSFSMIPPLWGATAAVLSAEQRSLEERQSETQKLELQAKSMPVEVDAARAAEAAGVSQLEHQKQGGIALRDFLFVLWPGVVALLCAL